MALKKDCDRDLDSVVISAEGRGFPKVYFIFSLGQSYLRAGNLDEASEQFALVINANLTQDYKHVFFETYDFIGIKGMSRLGMGKIFKKKEEWKSAAEAFLEIGFLYKAAFCYCKSQDFDNAYDIYSSIQLSRCDRCKEAALNIGASNKPEHLALAYNFYMRAICQLVEWSKSRVYSKDDFTQQALDCIECAIAINPGSPETYVQLAMIHEGKDLNKFVEAVSQAGKCCYQIGNYYGGAVNYFLAAKIALQAGQINLVAQYYAQFMWGENLLNGQIIREASQEERKDIIIALNEHGVQVGNSNAFFPK